jgi:hypothetical protein
MIRQTIFKNNINLYTLLNRVESSSIERTVNSRSDPLFVKHIISMQTGAMMYLGKIDNPVTGKKEIDTGQAKGIIDTLLMLRQKTGQNLSPEEDKILNNAITQLQYVYVEETILKKG